MTSALLTADARRTGPLETPLVNSFNFLFSKEKFASKLQFVLPELKPFY